MLLINSPKTDPRMRHKSRKVAENLLSGAGALAAVLIGSKVKPPGPMGLLLNLVGFVLSKEVLDDAAKLAGDRLREINSEALAKHDYLTATLTGFRMDLDKGEKEQILLRSRR